MFDFSPVILKNDILYKTEMKLAHVILANCLHVITALTQP